MKRASIYLSEHCLNEESKLNMTMNNNIDAVLTELGWNDGFRIPVANEENKRLEEEVIQSFMLY